MRHLTRPIRWPTMLGMTVVTILVTPATTVATDCSALDKAACERQASCTWVDPYKRMDGVKVGGFCRNRDRRNEPSDD